MAPGTFEMSLAEARDHESACVALVDRLAAVAAYKPSVYLERGGRLRCVAARHYQQVFDGIPAGAGLIGRTFATGEEAVIADVAACEHYLEITPGVQAEICVPVVAAGAVVGVLSVESFGALGDEDVDAVRAGAAALGARLTELGGGLRETPAQRLVRHATLLTDAKSRRRVEREVLVAAADVAGMDSAALLAADLGEAVTVVDAVGPLRLEIGAAPQEALEAVVGFVQAGTSCFTVGESGGQDFSGLAPLREAGVCSLAMLGLSTMPPRVLLVADSAAQHIATEAIELLELLCAHAASALRACDLVRDLRVQAATDPLTGLGHHRSFHQRLAEPLSDRPTAVILIDLDHFKAVNDTQGHVAGDRLLREVAAVTQAAVRDSDDVFRIGGDEFAVLAEAEDHEEAADIGRRVAAAVRERTAVTASIGVCLSEPHEPLDQALLRADRALYAAKAAGRDRALLHEAR